MKSSILKLPKLSKWMELIISVVIPVLLIFAVNQRVGIFFETNDDRFIMSLLAGVMTGEPDPHPFFFELFFVASTSGTVPYYKSCSLVRDFFDRLLACEPYICIVLRNRQMQKPDFAICCNCFKCCSFSLIYLCFGTYRIYLYSGIISGFWLCVPDH